jgi:hypothetical protein
MDAARILDDLAEAKRFPVEAIRAANENRAAVVPVFLRAIEAYLAAPGLGNAAAASRSHALFFVFHLLGQWREKAAYRLLAQLLRRPRDEIDVIFGGAITETTHRVMAAVFDGDPGPLYDVILGPKAEEFIRSRMFDALAMVTLRGELPREEAGRFLRACYAELEPQEENFAWDGWQCAIAMLGLAELKPQVEQAFARGFINNVWLEFKHFERDLQHAIDHPGAPPLHGPDNEYTLFGDTIEELSGWYSFRPKPAENDDSTIDGDDGGGSSTIDDDNKSGWYGFQTPVVNPFKHVGRDDPCPCGSGRKFKKCCLNAGPAALSAA